MPQKEIEKIFAKAKNVYFVGIKGAAVSGLAQILKKKGYKVSGSDTHEKFFTDKILKKARIRFFEGFSVKNLDRAFKNTAPSLIRANRRIKKGNIDLVVASNAYLGEPINNPEIIEIKKRGIPLISYPEALSHIFNKSFGIAIAGTHGKTTVTAAVAYILHKAGRKPNALIGAQVTNFKSNALVGQSDIFVLEADEYKDAFLNYQPNIIAILNTDWDHPDYFKTESAYKKSFEKFKKNLKNEGKIFTEKDFKISPNKYVTLLIGKHNQENLNAAAKICAGLGVKKSVIAQALKEFRGTNRRLEVIGKFKGNIVIDDYGHNSQKVSAGLKAIKEHYPKKQVIVVFQPHTYSRTEKFLKDFAKSLTIADKIYLLDIYASAREAKGKVSSDDLAREIKKLGKDAVNIKTIENAVKFFKKKKPKDAVIVAMGAGDVGELAYRLCK